jgi:hypothetical protein
VRDKLRGLAKSVPNNGMNFNIIIEQIMNYDLDQHI